MKWVAISNRLDDPGYRRLTDGDDAAAMAGAWYSIILAGSKGAKESRGILLNEDGEGLTPDDLFYMTGIPADVYGKAISRLLDIGWLEEVG